MAEAMLVVEAVAGAVAFHLVPLLELLLVLRS
jgi:hypothetical protein